MVPLIVSTGFLDGLNPCAFAVLLFFIAFLFTIKRTKRSVWKMGIVYIFAIFLAYLLIGLGLLKAFIFSGAPHLMAKIGAYLLIILGLINLSNFLLPKNKKIKLGVPGFSKKYIKSWLYRATLPAAFISGFLVGLCTFPCSGGMYVAIIGLLAAKTTYVQGLIYLIIYNIFFVVPLLIILIAASSKKMSENIMKWESSQSKLIKLILGVIMILLGLAILYWFI
jgi:cytochrome c biogenesis protein CcdA